MKKVFAILSVCTVLPLTANAELTELWATGVSESGGWSDFNKSGGDRDLCWAAAAANVIDWWQKQYEIPDDVPRGEDIWKTFKSSFVDEGGMPYNAIRWWIDGSRGVNLKDGQIGGYYRKPWDYYGRPRADDYVTNPIFSDTDSYADCSATIISRLEDGCGMTLALDCMHEVTLWGVEYDESNLITTIWITDSDDYRTGLRKVRCDGSTGKITLNGDDYTAFGRTNIGIYGYTVLMPADDFLTRISVPIPEPSAFGLLAGIAAIALAGTRRSRRRKYFSPEAFSLGERK